MLNYCAEQDGNSERFLLIESKVSTGSSDYLHISAKVVRKAIPSGINPDTGREQYNDGPNASGYRNCAWSSHKKGAVYTEDLCIWSQTNKHDDAKPYAVECLYIGKYSVDKAEAKAMADALTKIDNKLTKLDQEFGYGSGDLATYITRVASALGIKKFLTVKKNNGSDLSDVSAYNNWKATDIAFLVNNFVEEFRGPKAA
jgi:hypothetical protein